MLAAWLLALGLPAAHVSAEGGRVRLALDGSVELVRPGRAIEVPSAAHLEAGAGASACVSWSGVASLRATGPLALEWGIDGSMVRLLELGRIEIEMRSAQTVVLPDER